MFELLLTKSQFPPEAVRATALTAIALPVLPTLIICEAGAAPVVELLKVKLVVVSVGEADG